MNLLIFFLNQPLIFKSNFENLLTTTLRYTILSNSNLPRYIKVSIHKIILFICSIDFRTASPVFTHSLQSFANVFFSVVVLHIIYIYLLSPTTLKPNYISSSPNVCTPPPPPSNGKTHQTNIDQICKSAADNATQQHNIC